MRGSYIVLSAGIRGREEKRMIKLPSVLTEEEVLRLFAMAYNPHHKIQMQLMYYCGLRVSEMLAVTVDDLDFKEQMLYVRHGKGAKDRIVPMPKPLITELKSYLKVWNKTTGNLFNTKRSNTLKMCNRLGKKIGKSVHPHTLRHSYATHILEKTDNIELVKDLLGHTNIATTQIYTHLTTKAKKAGVDKVWT